MSSTADSPHAGSPDADSPNADSPNADSPNADADSPNADADSLHAGLPSERRPAAHRDRVIAVISSFRPEVSLIEHCRALAPQVSRVVVVDDGSGPASEEVLEDLEQQGVRVLRQSQNSGIAAAMNRGIEWAAEQRAEFVVTFDQDSQVPDGFVDSLIAQFDRLSATGLKMAMVAPEFFSQTPQTRTRQDRGFLEAYAPIQSGLLMPLEVVSQIGLQREGYFIDLVDTEYYLRARRAGYEAACVPGLVLPHGFGHRLYVHFLGRRLHKRNGRPRMVAVSSPFRYYYRARNRVVLGREYGRDRRDPEIRALLRRDARHDLILDYGVALWSARGKFQLLSLIFAGWRDGVRGRMGKMSSRLARRAAKVSWKHPVAE